MFKYLGSLICISLSLPLLSQIDTTVLWYEGELPARVKITQYHGNGTPYHVVYLSRADSLSMEEYFLLGINYDLRSRYFLVDSLLIFDSLSKRLPTELDDLKQLPDKYFIAPQHERKYIDNKNDYHLLAVPFGKLAIKKRIFIEGRMGDEVDCLIPTFSLLGPEGNLRITSNSDDLRFPSFLKIPNDQNGYEISVKVRLSQPKSNHLLKIDNLAGEIINVYIQTRSFDLKLSDFAVDIENAPNFTLRNFRHLWFKTDGVEKWLQLYRDGKLVDEYSIGEFYTKLSFKGFAPGRYILKANAP